VTTPHIQEELASPELIIASTKCTLVNAFYMPIKLQKISVSKKTFFTARPL
jgi:hypothetical protein